MSILNDGVSTVLVKLRKSDGASKKRKNNDLFETKEDGNTTVEGELSYDFKLASKEHAEIVKKMKGEFETEIDKFCYTYKNLRYCLASNADSVREVIKKWQSRFNEYNATPEAKAFGTGIRFHWDPEVMDITAEGQLERVTLRLERAIVRSNEKLMNVYDEWKEAIKKGHKKNYEFYRTELYGALKDQNEALKIVNDTEVRGLLEKQLAVIKDGMKRCAKITEKPIAFCENLADDLATKVKGTTMEFDSVVTDKTTAENALEAARTLHDDIESMCKGYGRLTDAPWFNAEAVATKMKAKLAEVQKKYDELALIVEGTSSADLSVIRNSAETDALLKLAQIEAKKGALEIDLTEPVVKVEFEPAVPVVDIGAESPTVEEIAELDVALAVSEDDEDEIPLEDGMDDDEDEVPVIVQELKSSKMMEF